MTENLQIRRDLTKDLLQRLAHPDEDVREAAVEALAMNASDEDWRADELISQQGINLIIELLDEDNAHIVSSALDIIIAVAGTGDQEVLLTHGVIEILYRLEDMDDGVIRKKAHEALWLLEPGVEDVVTAKPHNGY